MGNNNSANKRIAKNTLFLYGRMLFVLFVSIYTTRVVLNTLGVEDYGVYNVVCGFVAMFGFLNTSLSNGIQRFYNYEYGKGGLNSVTKVFQTALLIQVVLAIVLAILVESIGIWYINTKMVIPDGRIIAANWIFQFSVLSLLFLILQIPYSAAILAHEKMDYYAIVSVLDAILKLLIVVALPYLTGDKLVIYGILQVIVSIINFTLYYWYSKKNFCELKIQRVFHKDLFLSIFRFSGWNVFATFAWMTQGQGVNMVINLFFGTVVNAARGVSGQIQSAIQGFCENLVIAFRPQLVQSYAQGNYKRTERMMYSMSKVMFILFLIMSLPVCFEINYILKLWLGEAVPEYTAGFTILTLVSMFPRNFTMAFAQVVHATGKLGAFQITTAIIVLLTLPCSYITLAIGCDVMSVYWVNLAMCIILYVASICALKVSFPIRVFDYAKKVLLPCVLMAICAITTAWLPYHLMDSSFLRVIIVTVSGGIAVLLSSFLFVLDKEERNLLVGFIIRRKK